MLILGVENLEIFSMLNEREECPGCLYLSVNRLGTNFREITTVFAVARHIFEFLVLRHSTRHLTRQSDPDCPMEN